MRIKTINFSLSFLAVTLLLMIDVFAWAASNSPNVLLITSEDNGPELGCYGNKFVRTPNLDKLASEGVRFERAFVATASCSESRAAILTGLYPHQNGQIGLASHHYRTFENIPNLFSLMKAHGYRTGLIGKLHINPESAFPIDYRPDVSHSNTFGERDVQQVAKLAEGFFTESDTPFFLMVNYADAHLPFLRQQHGLPQSPLSADDVRPLPWIGIDTPGVCQSQADYYNCMMRMDEGIGMLMTKLDKSGLAKETLVIYLGDHGAQFPRGKLASYESSLRIPLIIRFPGRASKNVVRDELVSTVDLAPTILQAVGATVPENMPGRSLLPLISKRSNQNTWREYLFTEYHGHYPPIYFPQRTIRDDRYKLIINLLQDRPNPVAVLCSQLDSPMHPPYVSPSDVSTAEKHVQQAYETWLSAPPIELYDLQEDPYEWHDLANDDALTEVKIRLLKELQKWREESKDPLTEPKNLARLTAEHDALKKPYQKPKQPHWKYPEYLAPTGGEGKP